MDQREKLRVHDETETRTKEIGCEKAESARALNCSLGYSLAFPDRLRNAFTAPSVARAARLSRPRVNSRSRSLGVAMAARMLRLSFRMHV